MTTVAVIVLNWNRANETLRCLESLDSLEGVAFDIVVVDNGSHDGSAASIAGARPDLPIVRRQTNGGYAAGNNEGIRFALDRGAEFVWVLNNDTVVDPQSLASALAVMQAEEAVGIVGSALYASETGTPWTDSRMYPSGAVKDGRRYRLVGCQGCEVAEPPSYHQVTYISGAALLIRSDVFRSIGMFDESYFHYAEEVDFVMRARDSGWEVALACLSKVWHAIGGSLSKNSPDALYYWTRNAYLLHRRRTSHGVLRTICSQRRFTFETAKRLLSPRVRFAVKAAMLQGVAHFALGRTGPRKAEQRRSHRPSDDGCVEVLVISHSSALGGAERSLLAVLSTLAGANLRFHVLLPRPGPLTAELSRLGIPWTAIRYEWWIARRNGIMRFAWRSLVNLLYWRRLVSEAHRINPDVIWSNSIVVPQGALLARKLDLPHVWHVREILTNASMRTPLPRRLICAAVLRWSTRVVAVSNAVAKQFGSDPRVSVIYNSVPEAAWMVGRSGAPRPGGLERCPSGGAGSPLLILVGAIAPDKGQDLAIGALRDAVQEFPDAHLHFLGEGLPAYVARLEGAVQQQGLDRSVCFLGRRDDVFEHLRTADLALMLSRAEPFGLVTVEALALGIPVIGTNSGATPEILTGGGVLVERDVNAIAAAIRSVARDPAESARLRREALERAERFRIEIGAAKIASLLTDVSRGGSDE